jgi:hypothetical protein
MIEKFISCCGLDCTQCDARIATLKNDDELRKATAEKWQKLYNAPNIAPELINCLGCRQDGVKFAHCLTCEIRKCVGDRGFQTCGECPDMESCETVAFVHKHLPEAVTNLKSLN